MFLKELCNLDDEILCDYHVSSKMKKIWNIQLNALEVILNICSKHNLRIIADFGTLLGAIRHKGFIPWDDDIDMIMPRVDYEKFLEIAPKELPSPYFLQSFHTEKNYYEGIAKVRVDGTAMLSQWEIDTNRNWHLGIFVDIFPFDIVPDDYQERIQFISLQKKILNFMKMRYSLAERLKKIDLYQSIIQSNPEYINLSDQQLFDLYQKNLIMIQNKGISCGWLNIDNRPEEMWLHQKDCFDEIIYVPFENLQIPVSKSYETMLKSEYGDWKTPVKYPSLHNVSSEFYYDSDNSYKIYKNKYCIAQFVKFMTICSLLYKNYKVSYEFKKHCSILKKLLNKHTDKRVVLWGASVFLYRFVESNHLNFSNLLGVIDKLGIREGQMIGDKPILSTESIITLKPNLIIVTIVNNQNARLKEIFEYLEKKSLNIKVVCV